jgi:hypothetical protein
VKLLNVEFFKYSIAHHQGVRLRREGFNCTCYL